MPEQDEENVTLRCDTCGVVVGTINAKILEAVELAIADSFVIHKFNELDAPQVLTSISDECQRDECEKCPGVFHGPDAGDDPVFCVHDCHKAEHVSPIN